MSNWVQLIDLIEWNSIPEYKSSFGNSVKIYVYALIHPFLRTVRYIGISQTPAHRFHTHVCASMRRKHANKDLEAWVCGLADAGYYPKMVILELAHPGNCRRIEQAYIQVHIDTVLNRLIG